MRPQFTALALLAAAISSCATPSPTTEPPPSTPTLLATQTDQKQVPTIPLLPWPSPTPDRALITTISANPQLEWCRRRDPDIDPWEYDSLGYQPEYACRLLAMSPGGAVIAFATLERAQGSQSPEPAFEVVRRVNLATSTSHTVFRASEHASVAGIEWSPDQSLIVTNGDLEFCHDNTTIFPPSSLEPSAQLAGRAQPDGWNTSRSALFAVNYCPYAVPPSYLLSGYDFASRKPFPNLVSFHEETDGLFFIQAPTWSQNGRSLALTVREGNWVDDSARFLLRSSYVVVFQMAPAGPRIADIFHDEATDYSFQLGPDGDFQILSAPYSTMYDPSWP